MLMCPTCGAVYRESARHCLHDGARLRPGEELDPRLGSQVGNFRLTDLLGRGSMGVVYLADHIFIPKRAAIKILHEKFKSEPDLVTRFFQEALAATTIGHPNIIDVGDFGELADGCAYFVMEYVDGKPLDQILEEEGALALVRAAEIIKQIAAALAAAHDKGIIHRDLKPGNLMLRRRGLSELVKVLDFGMAKMIDAKASGATKPGTLLGTPQYMAPESIQGRPIDARADIYALGVVCYEMLAGRVPFDGTTLPGILRAQVSKPVPPIRVTNPRADVTDPVEQLILRTLAKDPAARPSSMRDFGVALQTALGNVKVRPTPAPAELVEGSREAQRLAAEMRRQASGEIFDPEDEAAIARTQPIVPPFVRTLRGVGETGKHPKATPSRADRPKDKRRR